VIGINKNSCGRGGFLRGEGERYRVLITPTERGPQRKEKGFTILISLKQKGGDGFSTKIRGGGEEKKKFMW